MVSKDQVAHKLSDGGVVVVVVVAAVESKPRRS